MAKYIVHQSGPLKGEVVISGAKNAVLPLMAAALLSEEECIIRDVPQLRDVVFMKEILASLGSAVKDIDENTVSGPSEYFNYMLTGNGYYAKAFELPEEFNSTDITLSIGYVDDRCEVFLNGKKVGSTGMNDAGLPNGETTWAKLSEFAIDPELLVRGGENVVVVRAWNDEPYGEGGWYDGPIALTGKRVVEEY